MARLLIFDTHPIPYRVPAFRALSEAKVYFFNSQFRGGRWWFRERAELPNVAASLEGYPSETLETDRLGLWRTWARLWKILETEKPRAILIYGYYLPEHWMLRILASRFRIDLLFCGETFSSGRGLGRRKLRAFFFRGVSRFLAIGKATKRFYEELGIPSEKIRLAPYGVDNAFFARERGGWRNRLNLPENAFVILFVGRENPRKRLGDAIELLRRLPEAHLVLAGVRAAPEPRVHCLGFQTQEELAEAYHGADLLFVPSEHETWGLVINEAFAAGLPALVTDACGAAEDLILPGQTGFTFPVGDLNRAEELVRHLIAEPARRRELGRKAQELVRRGFGPERFARAVECALNEPREVFGESRPRKPQADRPRLQPAYEG